MNLDFLDDLRNLDLNDIGRWPFMFRALLVVITFFALTIAGYYYFIIEQKMPVLEKAEAAEKELRTSFETKQRKAANFDAYKEQLGEIESSFGTMLQQLPGKTEIPNLLVDISQTGLAAGLDEKLFQPMAEVRKGFYAEKPIKIRLDGNYHEFGAFVSSIAALPRIVTLHDIKILPGKLTKGEDQNGDDLVLSVTAKTYRYLEEEEAIEDLQASKKKKKKG